MNSMNCGAATLTLAVALAVSGGCRDEPPTYDQQRPPADALVGGNTGIQGKDVLAATDRMVDDLLGLPALNASRTQWTVVLVEPKNNDSIDPTQSYAVFNGRLRSRLYQLGRGRVTLIENKATFRGEQNKELEGSTDPNGQGGGVGMPAGIQPNYFLTVTIDSLPGRAADYYDITATLTDFRTRESVWVSSPYEFQAAR